MGRHVGRSRGCQTCRQRKIKCDEKTPECVQCLRSGKKCPGPLQGTLFLVTTETRTKSAIRGISRTNLHTEIKVKLSPQPDNKPSLRRPSHNSTTSQTSLGGNPTYRDESSQSFEWSHIPSSRDVLMVPKDAKSMPQSQLPSLYQPSRSSAFQELFLDHFINAFFDPRCEQDQPSEWSVALPSFLQNQEPNNSIVHAIRAATMAHYAKISGDVSIQLNSMRWYASSLKGYQLDNALIQQRFVEGDDLGNIFTEILVTTPIMFMFFESAMGTMPSAWARHLKAASSMLEMIGPWRCRRGILHNIFKIIRIGAIYMGVTWEKMTVFASEEWSTIPYLQVKKTAYDRLNDILLQIPECLDMGQKVRQGVVPRSSIQASIQDLEGKIRRLTARLKKYWKEHGDEIDPDYIWDQYHEATNFQSTSDKWKMFLVGSKPVRFRDKFAARIIADYDAGNAILYSILRRLSPASASAEGYERRITVHCASILEAVTFLEKLGVGSGGNTSLIFPLKTVYLCSSSQQQQVDSAAELARWGKTRGVEGACEIFRDNSGEGPRSAAPYHSI